MTQLSQRVQHFEAHRIRELLAALDDECIRFAAFYGYERYREPLAQVLEPFSEQQIEVFCAALEVKHGEGYERLNVQDLAALVNAFRRHWTGDPL